MKIKTITCHEVYNHGASLQEYALLQFLNSNGHEAEAVHYKPSYLSGHFDLNVVSNPIFDKPFLKQLYLLIKLPGRLKDLKRKKAFDLFAEKYIPTGKLRYETNEDLKTNLPEADAFICGSDQIWNSFFQNGKDPAFYLNFVPQEKLKISYAASFATDEITDDVKPLVKENISKLDAVGVRETSGVRILNELGINSAVQVLDPVFLLEAEHWKESFVSKIESNYLFLYDFDSNPLIKKIALHLKKEKGYKIFTVNKNIDYADRNFYLDGPEQFLSLVHYSSFNITNSFHAVAFSLIFNKQFVVINRTDKINTRMRDLLGLLGLEKHLVSNYEKFLERKEINYNDVNEKVETKREFSKSFLLNSLKL
ncbi:polysaccharide pyruvyl transferase family protein [Flavobacterium sp. CAN_S2]|uniref:polysaccharide pyruvyl transferase family protein n=1 Tax=Flavobacterium sp. CAN_S2 TaxID=2787726 RepID=UPI0018CBA2B8